MSSDASLPNELGIARVAADGLSDGQTFAILAADGPPFIILDSMQEASGLQRRLFVAAAVLGIGGGALVGLLGPPLLGKEAPSRAQDTRTGDMRNLRPDRRDPARASRRRRVAGARPQRKQRR